MTLDEYQKEAIQFAAYSHQDYPFIALSEEVGEVSGKLAKASRKWATTLNGVIESICYPDSHLNESEKELKQNLKKELGDVLWQLQACCDELGFSLEEVAKENLNKLSGRNDRGTIIGEGDER